MNWFMNRRIAAKLVLTVSIVLVSSLLIGVVSLDRLSLVHSKAEDLGTNELMGTRTVGGLGNARQLFDVGSSLGALLWRFRSNGDGGEWA